MSGKLGLKETVAMGLGGLIGGGIFAVLGVAAHLSGNAAFLSYFFDGLIALASGYSYIELTEHFKEDGGSFTFLEHFLSNKNIAGVVGWILIMGYIGSSAMYAYAFGSFGAGLLGFKAGSIVQSLISIGVIALFVLINTVGVKSSGSSEDILVYAKALILFIFGGLGVWAIFTKPDIVVFQGGLFNTGVTSAITGAAVIFVSFQGFQLLTYEYSEIQGGISTLRKGVYYSIISATAIYILVSFVTTNLMTPHQIIVYKETALAYAAKQIFASPALNTVSYVLISIAALFSTASAINATLFGTARLSHKIATEKELPEVFSFRNSKGIPTHSILIIGLLTAGFTAFGSLEEISTFASVSFILIFATVNAICLFDSEVTENWIIPAIGLTGTLLALPLLIWHLYQNQPHILTSIILIFAGIAVFEFIYFERNIIRKDEKEIEGKAHSGEKELKEDIENEIGKAEEEIREIEGKEE